MRFDDKKIMSNLLNASEEDHSLSSRMSVSEGFSLKIFVSEGDTRDLVCKGSESNPFDKNVQRLN